jgi:predicted enzyme related to lactoylglutathione lyase
MHRLKDFYGLLGLQFDYHRHGSGPYHYSTVDGDTTIEIYPPAKGQVSPDPHLRLGFSVAHFDELVDTLQRQNVHFVTLPQQTEFGFMAVVTDPDGRKIELYRE